MASVVKRRLYVINIPPNVSIERLYEKIVSAIGTSYAEVRFQHGKMFIELVGTDSQIRESWGKIKKAVGELWILQRLQRGGVVSIEAIVKEAGRTFPPEVLVQVLKLQGYNAQLNKENNTIHTNAPAGEIIALARRIAEVIDEIRFLVKGTVAKRLIAVISVGFNMPAHEAIEYSIKAGVLVKSEEGLKLREEWRKALEKVVALIKEASELEHSRG